MAGGGVGVVRRAVRVALSRQRAREREDDAARADVARRARAREADARAPSDDGSPLADDERRLLQVDQEPRAAGGQARPLERRALRGADEAHTGRAAQAARRRAQESSRQRMQRHHCHSSTDRQPQVRLVCDHSKHPRDSSSHFYFELCIYQ